MLKYLDKVKIKGEFYEGKVFLVIDYSRWTDAQDNEIPLDNIPENNRAYTLYDFENNLQIRGAHDGKFHENELELYHPS